MDDSRGVNKMQISDEFTGGLDDTPIPHAPCGYTLKFTFHRGISLPVSDFGSFSSDPYVAVELMVDLPQRHKQDPKMTFRTHTIHKNTNPIWDSCWIVANVPASGFELKCRLYDEDPANHDDKLGTAFMTMSSIDKSWPGITEKSLEVKKHMASKRVQLAKSVAALTSRWHNTSQLIVSIENLGLTSGMEGGQVYTVGPNRWFKHVSPLIGMLAGTKDEAKGDSDEKAVVRYNFQAIQIQLRGPVPSELYHRYVEFRPFVAGMFTARSAKGWVLNRALHHQHARIYNFDRTTTHGEFASPCVELTHKLLEVTHYGHGGRIFTYVLTLDGQFRFTETGKEFRIDLLSKHTMHSNVSIYIAYSGEFFLRRRKHHQHSDAREDDSKEYLSDEASAGSTVNPADYEMFIDNESGTYRPSPQYLHVLGEFMSSNFPGLRISTIDCQKNAERLQRMKDEQREVKKAGSLQMTFLQRSSSSLSSSSLMEETGERNGPPPGKDSAGEPTMCAT